MLAIYVPFIKGSFHDHNKTSFHTFSWRYLATRIFLVLFDKLLRYALPRLVVLRKLNNDAQK